MPANVLGKGRSFRDIFCIRAHAGVFALAILPILVAPASKAGADEATALKLCADPSNLPFSSNDPAMPGIYLEIGQALGKSLGRPVAYDWYKSYFGKRTVRVTLLGKQCDAMIGLPRSEDFMGPAVIFSKPILTETYVLVSNKGANINGIDDLKGKRVAVQYLSTPQNLLAQRDEIEKVTVLSPEEGMKVLAQGSVDVAFIWGPVAGWLNKTEYNDRYEIRSTDGPGLSWPTAIGFAKTSKELQSEVDAALPGLEATIAALASKYGFPADDKAIKFGAAEPLTSQTTIQSAARPVVLAQVTAAASPNAGAVQAGREIFNGTCAHCHGPDAIQSERHIDLRRLRRRYADDAREKFWTTVHEGRPAKGMPSWKEVFDDGQLENVYAYLMTVQTPAD